MANLTGNSKLDASGIPTGSGKSPGVTALQAFQVGKVLTDTLTDDSAPLRTEQAGSTKATYSYSVSATAPYATPTDWIVIRGSATKIVKIVRYEFLGVATASINFLHTLRLHTTANTAGTSTNPVPWQHDSVDGAATALVLLYTAAPTITGTPAFIQTVRTLCGVTPVAGVIQPDRFMVDFSYGAYAPIVLHGVAQEFAINMAGQALPAGFVADVRIVWTEE